MYFNHLSKLSSALQYDFPESHKKTAWGENQAVLRCYPFYLV
jgi:hypothetical protein